ncbi:hypothetical protein YSA_07024 [Pseudomonas putida ND6]|uniref:Uncharacterized protein n=1 Tax=Pseudomonas putida ND6 TaxID=231023 RepID=I3UYI7_PSEPU|nr:hypothetical protein YSA_07024 [Pseudomonas putida ND6]
MGASLKARNERCSKVACPQLAEIPGGLRLCLQSSKLQQFIG